MNCTGFAFNFAVITYAAPGSGVPAYPTMDTGLSKAGRDGIKGRS